MNRYLSGVEFAERYVTLAYVTVPDDLRENGLTATHKLLIPVGSDYSEEIDILMKACLNLLDSALEDLQVMPPHDPDDEDDEDAEDDNE